MIVLPGSRTVAKALGRVNCGVARQTIRKASGEWGYRTTQSQWSLSEKIAVNFMYFSLFSWLLYRGYHDFSHHVVASKDYPKASSYTDAELGIPPDDEELVEEE
ncbi:hypothetical protein LOTGIDRAFT_236028 [Lottia gigantea]|uniref:Uncharacterized protein n=1 Tax=Lottia gigantea TaxID=225164 RepID=V3ZR21_LOTGI|nr:hypothetical protein LOTGIDRAFT_236028 [Lottia gigantea]ESO84985.1 hypothetical protein LOTGIDRAFT_236028 [Lottia gigantea]